MAPAQALMDLDQERKPEAVVKLFVDRENGYVSEAKDDALKCENNCEDNTFHTEILPDRQQSGEASDEEIDIIGCADTTIGLTKAEEDPDATEYSSSFGNTLSECGDGLKSNLSDVEVESQLCDENGLLGAFDAFDSVCRPRKKKLTAHWRRFIHPLMWRCKWLELRVKELQSQALKYDRELLAYSQEKQMKMGQLASEYSAAKLVPLPYQSHRKLVMKRRKRKRVEDTIDIPSYMSRHILFSYYENKKSDIDGASVDDDYGNQAEQNANSADEFGVNYEWPVFESKDGDHFLEQILGKIDTQESRVQNLKAQLNELICKHAGKFSSMENLGVLMPGDVPASSAVSPTLSHGDGDEVPVGSLHTPPGDKSECGIGDLVLPESAVSSFGEVGTVPGIIESTLGLLSAADVSLDWPQIGDSCKDIDDDVLIHNQAAKEELLNFEKVGKPLELPAQELAKEVEARRETTGPLVAQEPLSAPEGPEPGLVTKPGSATEQHTLRPCFGSALNFPKSKRKHGRPGTAFGRWNAKKVYSRRSVRDKAKK